MKSSIAFVLGVLGSAVITGHSSAEMEIPEWIGFALLIGGVLFLPPIKGDN